MATDFVFPEDSGTGATGGDNADAANFAALAHATGYEDYVDTGMGFTLNASTPSLDISAGMAVVTDSSAQEAQTTESRDQGVSYVVILSARSGLSLTDNDVNHVFLDIDLSTDDSISIHIDTDDTAPAEPSLKLGTVDTSNDTTDELNRDPPVRNLHFLHNRRRISSDDTIGESGYYTVDSSGGARTVTLASSSAVDGREINIKRDGGNDVTINTEGSENINGSSSIKLEQDQETITLVFDGPNSNWEVF